MISGKQVGLTDPEKGQVVVVAKSCPALVTPWTVARQAPVHGILQARILEWVAISFSRQGPDETKLCQSDRQGR